jgi:hypothetical protein
MSACTVPPLEALLPLPLDLVEVGLENAIEGRGAGIPGPVTGRHRHAVLERLAKGPQLLVVTELRARS